MNAPRLTASLSLLAALAVISCHRATPGGGTSGPETGSQTGPRSPTFTYTREQEGGCADLFFYKANKDRTEVLWVSADRKKLGLPEHGSKTFDLAAAPDGLRVAVDLWQAAPRFSAYCNDIGPDTDREATWKATKGNVTITVSAPDGKPGQGPPTYRATLQLKNIVFEDDAGHQATLEAESIPDVLVGWYAG